MVFKTAKGYVRKQLTNDGRESPARWADREIGVRTQTKTKIKRQKKAEEQTMRLIQQL